ncbi:MAG: magnesium transporter [Desulfurococcaceae archaeon]
MNAYEDVVEHIRSGRIDKALEHINRLSQHEIVEFLLRLESEDRRRILVHMDLEKILDELAKLPAEVVSDIVAIKGLDDIVRAVEKLPVDEAADFLSKFPSKTRVEVLRSLPSEHAIVIARLMKFPPESVGGVMTTMVPVFPENATVGETLDTYIHKAKLGLYESSHFIYVVDNDGKLLGYTDLRTLLTKPRDTKIAKCITLVKVHVTPFDDRETAAKLAVEYDLLEVPVVDFDGRFLGIVTLDDLLDVVISEYSEDLLKYAGFAEVVKGSYVTESPFRLALKRAPVLMYLYLINTVTGSIVAAFTEVIERIVLLAAFMPMLSDNSGNVGSQASALILRGLVTGEIKVNRRDILMVLRKEFVSTTFMLLLLLPLAFAIGFTIPFITTQNLYYSLRLALVVTSALAVSSYIADVVGSFLPILLAKLGIDPAAASAPVITSIGDICTVTVYFFVASALFAI